MAWLEILMQGSEAEEAARALAEALEGGTIVPEPVPPAGEDKAVDPVALAGLILAVPSAILAAVDLAERIEKRRKAKRAIERAQELQAAGKVRVCVVKIEAETHDLAQLDPDKLLELAERAARS